MPLVLSETSIDLGVFAPANVDRIWLDFQRPNTAGTAWVAWTGIDSVVFVFESPDRETTFSRNAVLGDDTTGGWYYDTTVTDFPDVAASYGHWTITPTVTDGPIIKSFPHEIGFYLGDQP